MLKTIAILPSPKVVTQFKGGFLSNGNSDSILKWLQFCEFFTQDATNRDDVLAWDYGTSGESQQGTSEEPTERFTKARKNQFEASPCSPTDKNPPLQSWQLVEQQFLGGRVRAGEWRQQRDPAHHLPASRPKQIQTGGKRRMTLSGGECSDCFL